MTKDEALAFAKQQSEFFGFVLSQNEQINTLIQEKFSLEQEKDALVQDNISLHQQIDTLQKANDELSVKLQEALKPKTEPEEEQEADESVPTDEVEDTPAQTKQIITTGYPYLNKATVGGQGNYGSLPKGFVFDVLDETAYYYKVTYKGNTGWVSKGYTKPYEPTKPAWEVKADELIAEAKTHMNGVVQYVTKYSPETMEFDCSSWTKYLYKKHDIIDLYWGARKQSTYGTKVEKKDLRKGDLVFFSTPSNYTKYHGVDDYKLIGHVGIYIGDGKFIHNLKPSVDVIISNINSDYYTKHYVTACRVIQ